MWRVISPRRAGILPFEKMQLNWRDDVAFHDDHVSVAGIKCQRVISCEGYAVTRNPHFAALKFNAAKGDILTVRFHGPMPDISLHRGIWIAPTAERDVFRVGATYDLKTLDTVPSIDARDELEAKLRAFVRVPYTVLAHQAAVRPIIHLSEAVIGLHPAQARLGLMNGLGSKGALHGPWYGRTFADFLVRGVALPADCDLRARM